MTTFALLAGFTGAAFVFWIVARWSSHRRMIQLGRFPRLALVAASLAATAAAGNAGVVGGVALVGIWIAATVDLRCGYVFDPFVAFALFTVLVAATACGLLGEAVSGAAATSGILLVVRCLSLGRGLGLGDVKLGALVGAGLGAVDGLFAVGTSFVLGAASAPWLIAFRKFGPRAPVPFVPYLLAGTLVVLAYHRFNTGVFR
jgi:leader peptidase (prepilin peptidase) / N-methyltransferase